ncbi:FAD-binding oxidoreductase [Ochrobactrum tritici]|nr:FAD-binding oxidoreductase [Brucella tritici]
MGSSAEPLPARIDVLIVGAGLTGLTAGHDLSRSGRRVVVLDSGEPGEGASSRNAGMLGRNTKHSF